MRFKGTKIHNKYNSFEVLPVPDSLVGKLIRLFLHPVTVKDEL